MIVIVHDTVLWFFKNLLLPEVKFHFSPDENLHLPQHALSYKDWPALKEETSAL